ncbi:MAG TPA: isochorismatase family protein [Candidatus Binatia bacterium]|nr:isochorismatase family protein [Candidatus Binatia bacterium]
MGAERRHGRPARPARGRGTEGRWGELEATQRLYASRGIGERVGFGARPAVLVVDFQRGLTDPAASALGARLDDEIAACRRLLDTARAARVPIHYTTTAYGAAPGDGGPFRRKLPRLADLREGTPLVDIDPRLARRPTETVWAKRGASAFFGTALAAALTAAGVDTVLVAGCTTSGCIRASVVDACQHGFRAIVVREAVGDRARAPHEANLFDMDAKYGDVVPLRAALAFLGALRAPRVASASGERRARLARGSRR